MTTPILDRAEFRAWLNKNYAFIVGYAGSCDECPIATYFYRRGECLVKVSASGYWINDQQRRPLAEWARKFVVRIDEHFVGGKVYGKAALAVLDSI